jgi:hypothetical protein
MAVGLALTEIGAAEDDIQQDVLRQVSGIGSTLMHFFGKRADVQTKPET